MYPKFHPIAWYRGIPHTEDGHILPMSSWYELFPELPYRGALVEFAALTPEGLWACDGLGRINGECLRARGSRLSKNVLGAFGYEAR